MFSRFKSFFRWPKTDEKPVETHHPADSSIAPSPTTRKRSFDKVDTFLRNGTVGDQRMSSRTSQATTAMSPPPKRVRLIGGGYRSTPEPDQSLATPAIAAPDSSGDKDTKQKDKRLMPPPSLPKRQKGRNSMAKTPSPQQRIRSASPTRSVKTEHTTQSTNHRLDGEDDFEAERARRYRDACTLPQNSGIWSSTEHDLFFHLAMRGYDPLVPDNWMRDFKTLPLALFAHREGDEPLISNLKDTEFRAIKALRDLFETGKNIRDKIISSPSFNIEDILLRATTSYMEWAMNDAGIFPSQRTLPVHRIAVRRKGQRTSDLITELESELYDLAQEHRDERGVLPSIEFSSDTHSVRNAGVPSVVDAPDALPTLTGIIITYGIFVLFTFNPNIKKIKTEVNAHPTAEDDEEMGIRYIAKFDFSDASMDVWNAFSVAIVCMMLRKTQVERGVRTLSREEIRERRRMEELREEDPDL